MGRRFFRSSVLALSALCAAGAASGAHATSYNIVQAGLSLGINGSITSTNVGINGEGAGMGEIYLRPDVGSDIYVYCIDVKDILGSGIFSTQTAAALTSSYNAVSASYGYTSQKLDYVGYLLAKYASAVHTAGDANGSAGLQLAIWEVLNESVGNVWDVGSGVFSVGSYGGNDISGAVTAAATDLAWLGQVIQHPSMAPTSFTMTILDPGAGNHNQPQAYVTVGGTHLDVPLGVPEPTTWGMIVVGFGLLGGALRRRKQDAVFA